jgi:hypothetical protein
MVCTPAQKQNGMSSGRNSSSDRFANGRAGPCAAPPPISAIDCRNFSAGGSHSTARASLAQDESALAVYCEAAVVFPHQSSPFPQTNPRATIPAIIYCCSHCGQQPLALCCCHSRRKSQAFAAQRIGRRDYTSEADSPPPWRSRFPHHSQRGSDRPPRPSRKGRKSVWCHRQRPCL